MSKCELRILHYVINSFPEQKKFIFRLYNTEDLENLYSQTLRYKISILDNDVYLKIAEQVCVLKNVDKDLILDFKKSHTIWGFSFLDDYHSVINGFYAVYSENEEYN